MLRAQFERAADDPAVRADEARLQEVLRAAQGELRSRMPAPTPAMRASSCPAAAGPRGRARWAC